MTIANFPEGLLARYPVFQQSRFRELFKHDVCVNPHGVEYHCEFGVSAEWQQETKVEASDAYVPVGYWCEIQIPDLPHIFPKKGLYVRMSDERIFAFLDTPELGLTTMNENIAKFAECWKLFKEQTPRLEFCLSDDEVLKRRWRDFQYRMWKIDPLTKITECIWHQFFCRAMEPL